MPTKLNKAGQQQEYVPAGNGDASGEYGNESGSNRHFQSFGKKKLSNFRKPFQVSEMGEKYKNTKPIQSEDEFLKIKSSVKVTAKDGKEYSYDAPEIKSWTDAVKEKAEKFATFDESKENGGMSAERVAYDENEIKKEINKQTQALQKNGSEPKYERKATFVFGLPAAGKSQLSDPLKNEMGAFEIDADLMKQHIPEFQNDPQMVSAVHEESSWMSKKMNKQLMDQGANLVIGKVGGEQNYNSILKMLNQLKERNYKIDIVVADKDLESALQANLGRFINRYNDKENWAKKPPRIVNTNQHKVTQKTYLDTTADFYNKGLVEGFKIYDLNSGKPQLVKEISRKSKETPKQEIKAETQVGKIKTYRPVGRTANGQIGELGTEARAKTLHNGLLMETKKSPREHFYGGSKGNYKIIDEETGTLVGFAKDYEDAIKYSQNQEWLDRIKRAKEVFFKKYPHLKKGTR